MEQQFCKTCKTILLPTYSFCPSCGLQVKEVPLTITVNKQVVLYLVSFFLPPFGLTTAIRYIRKGDSNAKRAGIISIILTVVVISLTIWVYIGFMNSLSETLNGQVDIRHLGY